jgi:hypothetical protein
MEEYILEVLDKYTQLREKVSDDTRRYSASSQTYTEGNQIQAINTLKNIEAFLLSEQESMNRLRLGLNKKDTIEQLYQDASELKTSLDRIEESYEHQL